MSYTPRTARDHLRDLLLTLPLPIGYENSLRAALKAAIEEHRHEAEAVTAQRVRREMADSIAGKSLTLADRIIERYRNGYDDEVLALVGQLAELRDPPP